MANLSNINNKFLVTTGGNVLIGQTAAVGTSIFQVTGSVNITGGTTSGLNITTSGTQDTININRAASNDNAITKYQTASADKWIVGLRNTSDDNFRFYSYGTSTDVLTINQGNGSATFAGTVIGTTARFDTLNNSANSKNLIYRNSSGAKTVVGGGPTPDKIYILDGGNVGIGASLPGAKLDVVGSGKFQPGIADGDALVTIAQTNTNAYVHAGIKINAGNTNPFYIYQSGSSNTLRFNYNSLADAGGQLVITDSGNVGIGTTSPNEKLVIGTTGGTQNIEISNSYIQSFNRSGSPGYQTLNFYASSYAFNVGNVGIGTTSPSSKLHVTGAPANGVYLSYLYNSGTHNSSHGLNVQTAANNIATYGLRVNTGGDSNALAVMGNGNVGIGTASPSQKLEVVSAGFAYVRTRSTAGSFTGFDIGQHTGGGIFLNNRDNTAMVFMTNNTERMNILAGGTGTFYNAFSIQGDDKSLIVRNAAGTVIGTMGAESSSTPNVGMTTIRNNGTTTIQFNSNGSSYINSGNVGIGTTSPSAKLHIGQDSSLNNQYLNLSNTETGHVRNWSIGLANASSGAFRIFDLTANTERMRITSAGVVKVNSGNLVGTGNGIHLSGARMNAIDNNGTTADNSSYLGYSSGRWIAVYAVSGTIQTSDVREKTEIKSTQLGLDFVNDLNPVSYKWIDGKRQSGEKTIKDKRQHQGLIAQEVTETLEKHGIDKNEFGGLDIQKTDKYNDFHGMSYEQFIAPMIKAIQELKAEIELLKNK